MNRNTEAHFAMVPGIDISRSKFERPFTHIGTCNAAALNVAYVDPDIIPGDTITMKQAEVIRMMTPIAPVMDNCYMDFYWFFVPNRLLMTDWKKLMGENESTPWTQTGDYKVPQLKINNNNKNGSNSVTSMVLTGSVLDQMGIPIQDWSYAASGTSGSREIEISSLPTKAYCMVWNEFFRDQNWQNPVNIPKDNTSTAIKNKNDSSYTSNPEQAQVQYAYLGGLPPLKVCKPHDYFTSVLPAAQKGPAVKIPLSEDKIPVQMGKYYDNIEGEWRTNANYGKFPVWGTELDEGVTELQKADYFEDSEPEATGLSYSLYTDLSSVTGATVTQLRQAFAIQKFYESDARSGTRYIESIKAHYGVTNPDYRLQRPEYLGGFRQNINVNQVIQSTQTLEDSTGLGTTGAYSFTTGSNNDVFSFSATEFGVLLGLFCIRTEHTYQQGINRAWFKKSRLDWYSPEFANLSEMAVLNREIYAQGTAADNEAFGYQEAWAEMKYMPNLVSGLMRSAVSDSLDIWHYADYYAEKPTAGNKWIQETDVNINRTLAIQNQDQFMYDFYFEPIYTRPMPLYSVPGLIDHH